MGKLDNEPRLDNVPVSEEVKSGMSLNICDQQWIKRLLDMQAAAIGEDIDVIISNLVKSLAQVVSEANQEMLRQMNDHKCLISGIKEDVQQIKNDIIDIKKQLGDIDDEQHSHATRIAILEKYASFWNTVLRVGLAAAIAVGICLLIF